MQKLQTKVIKQYTDHELTRNLDWKSKTHTEYSKLTEEFTKTMNNKLIGTLFNRPTLSLYRAPLSLSLSSLSSLCVSIWKLLEFIMVVFMGKKTNISLSNRR